MPKGIVKTLARQSTCMSFWFCFYAFYEKMGRFNQLSLVGNQSIIVLRDDGYSNPEYGADGINQWNKYTSIWIIDLQVWTLKDLCVQRNTWLIQKWPDLIGATIRNLDYWQRSFYNWCATDHVGYWREYQHETHQPLKVPRLLCRQ